MGSWTSRTGHRAESGGSQVVKAQAGEIALLVSASELAQRLKISERTLWRLLSAGKVPAPVRFGHNTRWRLPEVQEWIDRGCPDCMGRMWTDLVDNPPGN